MMHVYSEEITVEINIQLAVEYMLLKTNYFNDCLVYLEGLSDFS